ncbi:MAG: CHAT domain-containing protein [Pseudomonadota bacterium]
MSELPVVFLAFANAVDRHLPQLKSESRKIYSALSGLEDEHAIQLHREESSSLRELYEDLLRFDGRIVVFHYGGHADGSVLELEDGEGGAQGLARLLGQQSSLKLVFLNGCATRGHVDHLLKAGVPAVIATSVEIGDSKAEAFSAAFYTALAGGRSIEESFAAGSALVESQFNTRGDTQVVFERNTDWEDDDEEFHDKPVLEWALYQRGEAAPELAEWRLETARADWEIQLSDAQGLVHDLEGRALVTPHRARTRFIEVLSCPDCGAQIELRNSQTTTCPVCGCVDTLHGETAAEAVDRVIEFSITETQAREQILEAFGDNPGELRLSALYVPFWLFDLHVRSDFHGERGVVRDFSKIPPQPDWEPVKGQLDLASETVPIHAGAASAGEATGDRNWYWNLDQEGENDPGTRDQAYGAAVLSRSLQDAFTVASDRMLERVHENAVQRIGGQQQRNVESQTRYRELHAHALLLPHWYGVMTREGHRSSVVVNGHSGALRALQLPGTTLPKLRGVKGMANRIYEPSAGRGSGWRVSVFSGAGIGLMVGALLGLAMSPTVAGFVAAIGAVLAALLGLNEQNFGVSKGLRIGSFGIAAIVGATAGIYAREHRLFAPDPSMHIERLVASGYSACEAMDYVNGLPLQLAPPENLENLLDRKHMLLDAGYSECQVLRLLASRPASTVDTERTGEQASVISTQNLIAAVGLTSDRFAADSCARLDALEYPYPFSTAQLGGAFRGAGAPWESFYEAIVKLPMNDADKSEALFMARDLVCSDEQTPTPEECAALRMESTMEMKQSQSPFLQAYSKRISGKLSQGTEAAPTLSALATTFCSTMG